MRGWMIAVLTLAGCAPMAPLPPRTTTALMQSLDRFSDPPAHLTLTWLSRGSGVAHVVRVAGEPPRRQDLTGDFVVSPFGQLDIQVIGPAASMACDGMVDEYSLTGTCRTPAGERYSFQ